METQIAARHLEVFGVETPERLEHVAQVIARLRARAVGARGPTAWKRPVTDDEQPSASHQGDTEAR